MTASGAIRRWLRDPTAFARECLRLELDAWQAETLMALTTNHRVALKACKGPGKTFLLAIIVWWFLLTRPHPKIACTSITGDNLRDGLWTELALLQKRSPLLMAAFDWAAERITSKAHPETWWCSARKWAKGSSAGQQADTLAGLHAEHLLFIVDEAGGVPDAVAAAAEAGLANGGDSFFVIAGNPTHLSGPLYRASTSERHLWWVKEITGDPDAPDRAQRISVTWAREQIEKYGRSSPYVIVNVFGEFPPSSSNTLIGPDDVSRAMRRTVSTAEVHGLARILGVDVARFGDDASVLAGRQGRGCTPLRDFRGLDTIQLAGQVVASMDKWRPDLVAIDETGVGGGLVDVLRSWGRQVVGVQFGARAMNEQRFANRRAEMWVEMCEWIKAGGCLPNSPTLLRDLSSVTYRFDSKGRYQLESKEELKGRGLDSPDEADAIALTFAVPGAVIPAPPSVSAPSEWDPYQ